MRHKNNKLHIALVVVFILLVVGYRTWRDLHPQVSVKPVTIENMVAMYSLTQAENIPDDTRSLIVDVAMTPFSIPQRTTILHMTLTEIPQNYSELFNSIKEKKEAWSREGTNIRGIIFNLQMETVDWEAAGTFFGSFRAAFDKKLSISIGARENWFSDEATNKKILDQTKASAGLFIFPADGQDLRQQIKRLEKTGVIYSIWLDAPPGKDILFDENNKPSMTFKGLISSL